MIAFGFVVWFLLVHVLPLEMVGGNGEGEVHRNCPPNADLVCGENGKIYKNKCFLDRDDIRKAEDWEACRGKHWLCPLRCSKMYSPVCGSDNVIYSNRCHMQYLNCGTLMIPRAKEACHGAG